MISQPRPNPVVDRFTIDVRTTAVSGAGRLVLYNVDGREVYSRTVPSLGSASQSVTIDRSDLSSDLGSGTYFLSIEVGGVRGYRRVVVR